MSLIIGKNVRIGRGAGTSTSIRFGKYNSITPLTILGSLAWWVRADLGITISTGVSAWADQSGNGVNFTQGSSTLQPTFVSSAINGLPSVRGDGVNDVLSATWARVAPGTQPFYIWLIYKTVTWTLSKTIVGDYTTPNGFITDLASTTPSIRTQNVVTAMTSSGAAVGSFARVETQFTNSTSDYIKAGSVLTTGTNLGNLAGGGTVQLFKGGPNAGTGANIEIAEAFAFLGTPNTTQRAQLDAYCTNRYGSGLV